MTPTDILEHCADREMQALASATTLQELLDRSADILTLRGIDHAILISVPSPLHSAMLPVLPIKAAVLRCVLAAAVHTNAHPAAALSPVAAKPKQLSQFGIAAVAEPALADLLEAYAEAGMGHVYELLLEPCGDARVVLEIARVGQPIEDDLLSDIQRIMKSISHKLPKLLTTVPRHGDRAMNVLVR